MKLKIIACSIGAAFGLAGCASHPVAIVASAVSTARSVALELQQNEAREAAIKDPDAVIRNAPYNAEVMYQLGRYYQNTNNPSRAIVAYKEAIVRDPQLADAYNGLGVIYASQGRYDEAIQHFEKATSIAPQLAYLRNNLGYAHLLRGSNAEALKVLNEARRIDPTHDRTLRNLQLTHRKLDQPGEGRTVSQVPEQIAATVYAKPVVVEAPPVRDAASVRNAPEPDMKLVTVSPSVYELQAPASAAPVIAAVAPALRATNTLPMTVAARPFRLEVSNGNGITGLAKRVSQRLRELELYAARLTNQLPAKSTTSIEYRDGYDNEANKVAGGLQRPVSLVRSDQLRHDIHVRLVLGRDVRTDIALFQLVQPGSEQPSVASEKSGVGKASGKPQPTERQASRAQREAVVDGLIQEPGKRRQTSVIPGPLSSVTRASALPELLSGGSRQ